MTAKTECRVCGRDLERQLRCHVNKDEDSRPMCYDCLRKADSKTQEEIG